MRFFVDFKCFICNNLFDGSEREARASIWLLAEAVEANALVQLFSTWSRTTGGSPEILVVHREFHHVQYGLCSRILVLKRWSTHRAKKAENHCSKPGVRK